MSLGLIKNSIYEVERELKRCDRSVYHRLLSIQYDADYVEQILRLFPEYRCFSNLRCGPWYCKELDGTCYFKSTDGHCGHWHFSHRRINFHVAFDAAKRGGCMIIDSTRKGKSFPDSLSRTIPIWATTLNRVVMRVNGESPEWGELHFPRWVSESERSQVEVCVEKFADDLVSSSSLSEEINALCKTLKHPFRCWWISRGVDVPSLSDLLQSGEYTNLLLICASEREEKARETTPWYIQGAADDQESWSRGLTDRMFWKSSAFILSDGESVLDHIDECVCKYRASELKRAFEENGENHSSFLCVVPNYLWICTERALDANVWSECDFLLNCSPVIYKEVEEAVRRGIYLQVREKYGRGKQQRYLLCRLLPVVFSFCEDRWPRQPMSRLLIHSGNGDLDLCICISIALMVKFFEYDGKSMLKNPRSSSEVDKGLIRHFMLRLSRFKPEGIAKFMLSDLCRYFSPQKNIIQCI